VPSSTPPDAKPDEPSLKFLCPKCFGAHNAPIAWFRSHVGFICSACKEQVMYTQDYVTRLLQEQGKAG
jgi:hypothetical protein